MKVTEKLMCNLITMCGSNKLTTSNKFLKYTLKTENLLGIEFRKLTNFIYLTSTNIIYLMSTGLNSLILEKSLK